MNWLYVRHVERDDLDKLARTMAPKPLGALVGLRGPDGRAINSVPGARHALEALEAARVPTGLWTAPNPLGDRWASDLAELACFRPDVVVLDPEEEWREFSARTAEAALVRAREVCPDAQIVVAVYPGLPRPWPWRAWAGADVISPMVYAEREHVRQPPRGDADLDAIRDRMVAAFPGLPVWPSVAAWGLSPADQAAHLDQCRLVWPGVPMIGWPAVAIPRALVEALANG